MPARAGHRSREPCAEGRGTREDGSLGGYRWGLERKAALLARERGA